MGRGGWQQKARRDHAGDLSSAASSFSHSFLAAFLINLWAWGLVSPQLTQQIFQRALKDLDRALAGEADAEAIRKEYAKLAGMGSHGKYSNNCNRDMKGLLQSFKLPLHYFRMPMNLLGKGASTCVYLFKQAMLLPHELFACVGLRYPKAFAALFFPGADRLQQFWDAMAPNPQLRGQGLPFLKVTCLQISICVVYANGA